MKCHFPPLPPFHPPPALFSPWGSKPSATIESPCYPPKEIGQFLDAGRGTNCAAKLPAKFAIWCEKRSERSVLPAYCFDNMPVCFVSFFCNPTLSFVPVTSVRVQKNLNSEIGNRTTRSGKVIKVSKEENQLIQIDVINSAFLSEAAARLRLGPGGRSMQ